MAKVLDRIHHTAIQVSNISESVAWYTEQFSCDIEYQDKSWAMLKFANTSLALVLPEQHPHHFAIVRNDISSYDKAVLHRDGTTSVYIKDQDENNVELLALPN